MQGEIDDEELSLWLFHFSRELARQDLVALAKAFDPKDLEGIGLVAFARDLHRDRTHQIWGPIARVEGWDADYLRAALCQLAYGRRCNKTRDDVNMALAGAAI